MRILRLATVFLLASAAAPSRPARLERLRTQCLLTAAEVKNPWAMAHGITAFGKSFVASDGRPAADAIVDDYLMKAPDVDGGPHPGAQYGFLKYAADGTPIEPHTNLIVRDLVNAGMKPSTKFKTKVGTVTLEDLVRSAEHGFIHTPTSAAYWLDVGWTLDLLAHVQKPGDTFEGYDGAKVKVDRIFDDALNELERENGDLELAMKKGLPMVPKRKQGIYAHNCGGIHFIEGVLAWARYPQVKKKWGKRLDTQIDIVLWRLNSERLQYQAALQQAPQYRLQLLVQQLKFYGHFLELTGRLKNEVHWKPTDAQMRTVRTAEALLDDTVMKLDAIKAFDTQEQIKKTQPQIALDLIGDSCHAANGWEMWR